MSSTNKIDYSLRVNKSIERKLIAEGIKLIMTENRHKYTYVGFGSVWFVDFALFHKLLHIDKMISIEQDEIVYKRALFNKPYDCIDVRYGDSRSHLSTIIGQSKSPCLIWLDYDSSIFTCASFASDVDAIIKDCKSGTVVLVTMNVGVNRISKEGKKENPKEWLESCKETLKTTFGNINLSSLSISDLSKDDNFNNASHEFLAGTFANMIYKGGNTKQAFRIFDFYYKDGAPMISQGFLILDKEKISEHDALKKYKRPYFMNDRQFVIDAPLLTLREKSAIDKLLPSMTLDQLDQKDKFESEGTTYLNIKFADQILFPVPLKGYGSYLELYKYYPTFAEILNG